VSYQDKTLTCVDCGATFTFTAGEQEFHAAKGFTNEPKRCPSCRSARRMQRQDSGYSPQPAREVYVATCARCGGEARLPFQPRGDKPVYCSDCFRTMQPAGGRARR
jgi:CxxC-x17-CxxC domain-containing protein